MYVFVETSKATGRVTYTYNIPKIAIFVSLKLTLLSVNCHQFIHLLFLKEETLPAQNQSHPNSILYK